jgi:hypothetical protein
MQRLLRTALLTALVSISLSAPARPKIDGVSERLKTGADFRVRVQAALELGKSGDTHAVPALVSALDDENASVRAAAAAALGKLGDKRGRAPLEEHANDASVAVRSEVRGALAKLSQGSSDDAEPRKIVVRLGGVHNGTRVRSEAVEHEVLSESRRKLGEFPGIDVVAHETSTSNSKPEAMVMVTPSIQKLSASRDGDSIVYQAKVEYILQTLPDETIMARLSGSASAAATEREAGDRVAIARLRHEVLSAAIQSALTHAPSALVAAARL